MSSIKDTFFEECEELLEALTEGLSAIQEGAHDNDRVNAVFRAVHSIKGGAGAFGLDELVSFSHAFENVLDCLRSEKLTFSPELIDLLVHASDQLADLVESSRDERETDGTIRGKIVEQLESYLGDEDDEVEITFQPMVIDLDTPSEPEIAQEYIIQFCPQTRLYQNGHEPLFLLRALAEIGDVSVDLIADDLPECSDLDPGAAYLGWTIRLSTLAPQDSIESIFEFVDGLCELNLTFIESDEMAELNGQHMGKDGPTDVLSFPLDDEEDLAAPEDMPRLLGDVLICPEVVAAQAPDTTEEEMALMVVHGVLHILGMDHQEPDEEAEMKDAEQRHLSSWRNRR